MPRIENGCLLQRTHVKYIPIRGMVDKVYKTNIWLVFQLQNGNNPYIERFLSDRRCSLYTFDGLNQPYYHEGHGILQYCVQLIMHLREILQQFDTEIEKVVVKD